MQLRLRGNVLIKLTGFMTLMGGETQVLILKVCSLLIFAHYLIPQTQLILMRFVLVLVL